MRTLTGTRGLWRIWLGSRGPTTMKASGSPERGIVRIRLVGGGAVVLYDTGRWEFETARGRGSEGGRSP